MAALREPDDREEARRRMDAAAALLARALVGDGDLREAAESAVVWIEQAARWLDD